MRVKGAIHVAMLGIAIILFGTLLRAQDVTIVINRGSSVSQITEAQLRDIFTGTRSRFDAQRVCFRSGTARIRRRHSGSDRLRQPVEKP
jgi:hypothetical protein